LIFTQDTKLNLLIYEQFILAGIENVFMYDSMNETKFSRSEAVEKFRDIDGSILFNVGCFTKGFDVTDVEAVIVARRVGSLSLWIQMVGRGSRTTDKTFKDRFIVIDGGTNIQRLGRWSENYDWNDKFWCKGNYKPKKEAPEEEVKECENCKEFMNVTACFCKKCEHNNCAPKDVVILDQLAVKINSLGVNIEKIISYSENKDKFFALKMLNSQTLRMFENVPKEQFLRNLNGGVKRYLENEFRQNFKKIINSNLESKARRTFENQKNKMLNQLKQKYEIQ